MVGSDLKSATPFDTRELRSSKMVEAAVIEPEDGSPVDTANRGKKGAKSLQFKELQASAGVSKKQKAEEAEHLAGIDPNAIYAICMQQPELARIAQVWAGLSDEKRACILAIVDENQA